MTNQMEGHACRHGRRLEHWAKNVQDADKERRGSFLFASSARCMLERSHGRHTDVQPRIDLSFEGTSTEPHVEILVLFEYSEVDREHAWARPKENRTIFLLIVRTVCPGVHIHHPRAFLRERKRNAWRCRYSAKTPRRSVTVSTAVLSSSSSL